MAVGICCWYWAEQSMTAIWLRLAGAVFFGGVIYASSYLLFFRNEISDLIVGFRQMRSG